MNRTPQSFTLADMSQLQKENELLREEKRVQQEVIYRLQAVESSQKDALNHWRKAYDEKSAMVLLLEKRLEESRRATSSIQNALHQECRAASWVERNIGMDHMAKSERAMRLFEEAAELAQSEGITDRQLRAQVDHVFSRPPGCPKQEAGGVAVCLYAWCAAAGTTLEKVASHEFDRIEAKTIEEIRGSLARKQDADLVTVLRPESQ